MTRKIAVAIINGLGSQTEQFAENLCRGLLDRCNPQIGAELVLRVVNWADTLRHDEAMLRHRLGASTALHYPRMRAFISELIADGLAYQPTPGDRRLYDDIHAVFAQTLNDLARAAGADAPLCVIAHGFGSVIASNYFYDLQHPRRDLIAPAVLREIDNTPLERGETFALFFTLSSPIALWNLRYPDFGTPIAFPPPTLFDYHPDIAAAWINYYDPQDVLGYPLKALNEAYWRAVTEDRPVSTGRVIENLTPHTQAHYSSARAILDPIAHQLIETWRSVNEVQLAR